jgi:leucyl aminopeptidase
MLKFRIGSSAPKASALAVPVLQDATIPQDWIAAAEAAGFTGAFESVCEILTGDRPILLVGVGEHATEAAYRKAGATAVARLPKTRRLALDARALLPTLGAAFAQGAALRGWRPADLRSIPDPDAPALAAPALTAIDILSEMPGIEAAWEAAHAAWRGAQFARDLVTEPSNTLTPKTFVDRLEVLEKAGVQVSVLKRRELAHEGLGALLAVGRGSEHPPRLVVLRLEGAMEAAPVVFVGKGITFDTGGICVKPADKMWEMRADMAGAACCAGAMFSLALRGSPAPVVAILALAENALGAESYRPSDVLTSFSGKTIEVIDTDAEGRLVLADALAWAVARHKPQAIIDLATLTGSIVTALGHHMAGMFANDPALAAYVAAAGEAVGELVWHMPIGDSHREDIKSDIADLRHCKPGRMQPDACQAAAFLREFVGETPWVHLDIAAMDTAEHATDQHAQGATGFGVRLLDRLIAQRFEDPHRV